MTSFPNDEKKKSTDRNADSKCSIWCILDGKAGHEAQTRGLLTALRKKIPISSFEIPAPSRWHSLLEYISKKFPTGERLPRPDLIIGAGSRTHLAVLAANRRYGGKTIILMRPTLPTCLFRLCLIPKHDLKQEGKNVVLTDGVLNTVQPALNADPKQGLFLIGGPSAHYDWDTNQLLEQVTALVNETSEIQWTLTTSRRTPSDCTQKLMDLSYPNLKVIPVQKTPAGWVASMLQKCGVVWVSEDSVSMVYEALTAGAFTGLLNTPSTKGTSRVHNSVRHLLEQKRVVNFSERDQLFVSNHDNRLAEADRCADYIIAHLLNA